MLVEEVPKRGPTNSSTIYFSSSVNLQARPSSKSADSSNRDEANRTSKSRPKVNYNLTELLNAQTHANYSNGSVSSGVYKSSHQMQLEKLLSKRLSELGKETPNANFELRKRLLIQASINT
ncbi:hypothetical protein JCM33374_g4435 [Metschnikowia sp. JCM 33374]|nr:hypothetical protein JCM33374_g4435 [Metschnikowia sp. JCM 33374]